MSFQIITDITADLTEEYCKQNDIDVIHFKYYIDSMEYSANNSLDDHVFYDMMRQGSMPKTSQVNPEEAKSFFLNVIKKNKEILCLSFSSGLSGSVNSERLAANEVMEENPDVKIIIIDTLCASLGQGLIVHKAVEMRKQGKSLIDVADWIEKNKLNLVHVFTVDDLNHLHRGGRISKTVAVVGTLAGIKPVLHVDNEGHLIPLRNIRGRKKALKALVDEMELRIKNYSGNNDIVFISHGDCLEDALFVKNEVEERFHIHNFLLNYIGPTIGTHSGPGTVALFFMGDQR